MHLFVPPVFSTTALLWSSLFVLIACRPAEVLTVESDSTDRGEKSSVATEPAATERLTAKTARNQPESADEGFSIMTWNLEWFFDEATGDNYSKLAKEMSSPDRGRWDWRRDAVAAAVAKVQPTVIALQEVENRKVLYYLSRALERDHQLAYDEYLIDGIDYFTEQDVGVMATGPAEVIAVMRSEQSKSMKASSDFGSVSKHVFTLLTVPVGDTRQRVLIANLHLRAKPEAAKTRGKQIATLNVWLDQWIAALQNVPGPSHGPADDSPLHVIVTGDFNTEQLAGAVAGESEMGQLISRGTQSPDDDLIDLHQFIDRSERGTHLLPGRQFDRILVSRSLVEDAPGEKDLVLEDVRVRRDINVRGGLDDQQEHWDGYWNISDASRDISDHSPVVARFSVR